MKKVLVSFFLYLMCSLTVSSVIRAEELAKSEFKCYGFIKLDTSFDDSKTDNPNAAKFALSENSIPPKKLA